MLQRVFNISKAHHYSMAPLFNCNTFVTFVCKYIDNDQMKADLTEIFFFLLLESPYYKILSSVHHSCIPIISFKLINLPLLPLSLSINAVQ